jgi:4-hydroxy-L-threonine phosphate dehydrogenase PdxA
MLAHTRIENQRAANTVTHADTRETTVVVSETNSARSSYAYLYLGTKLKRISEGKASAMVTQAHWRAR